MKATLFALFIALLMVGCGEEAQKEAVQEEAKDDPSVPLAIPCVACGEKVSKKTEKCLQCGHPTPDSVVAYKKAQELERIRAEEQRKWREEQRRLAAIRAEEERKRELKERRLAAIRAEKKAKAQAKQIGLDDHTIILNAVGNAGDNYSGWVKAIHDNGQIKYLGQLKDGKRIGLWVSYYKNGQKWKEINYKDGKLHGLWTVWWEDGGKVYERKYKDGWVLPDYPPDSPNP